MSSLENIIKKRRSVRKYEEREVPENFINKLIESIQWSPSWTNSQCWEIVIIKNDKTKYKLQDTLPVKGNPARNAIIQAPILICLCAKKKVSGYYNNVAATKFGDWLMYDLGIATQSLCLTAYSLGLGTVIVGLFDHNKARKIINIPEEYELITMIPVGFPAIKPTTPTRRNLNEFVHNEFF